MNIHKVRKHKWENGVLNTIEHIFYTLETALHFCHHTTHTNVDVIKVISPEGEVVHSVALTPTGAANNTYA
jgi:hypothetical protein